ncbi:MAG: hypothetical protein ACRBM6_11640 [Geminicoccales bacterium]
MTKISALNQPMPTEDAKAGSQRSPSLTRRQLLSGTGKAALFAALPFGCVPASNSPFADGTFWSDGSGWTT